MLREVPVERLQLLSNIARWYYLEGLSQNEIARRASLSRPSISRLLTEARRLNVVEIKVHQPIPTAPDLETELARRFSLREVHVLERGSAGDADTLRTVGRLGARVLDGLLQDGLVFGLMWGMAVDGVVKALRKRQLPGLKILQLLGGVGAPCIDADDPCRSIDGAEQVWRAAQILGAQHYYLNAPVIVDSPEVAAALRQDHSVKELLELARQTDVALVGVGSTVPEIATLFHAGYVSRAELAELERRGAVGSLCGHYLNLRGEYVTIPRIEHGMIGVAWEDLGRFGTVIAVAGGRLKAPAILGALRSGIPHILVTDDAAAECVLDLAPKE